MKIHIIGSYIFFLFSFHFFRKVKIDTIHMSCNSRTICNVLTLKL